MENATRRRVSPAQWELMVEFLERNPSLLRGYNNSNRGRAQAAQLWGTMAIQLNAEGHGTTKTPKEWAIYVSNHKSKLKKVVADINTDADGTGGGPPRASPLSEIDKRFLAILGPGFGATAPQVRINPFPGMAPSTSQCDVQEPQPLHEPQPQPQHEYQPQHEAEAHAEYQPQLELQAEPQDYNMPVNPQPEVEPQPAAPTLPRRTRQGRYHTRPLAPLDEARRILAQVEQQRAAADTAAAQAMALLAEQVGRIADILERYLFRV